MNKFEMAVARYLGENNLKRIQRVKVGIAGAGGLGSNCAFNLVRSGFKKIKVVDFDVVEYANLNRQFYFLDQVGRPKVEALRESLLRINPDLCIETVFDRITNENAVSLFEDCDVVVEAFDAAKSKRMLVEKFYSSGKLLVSVSGIAGSGNSDDIIVRKIHSKFYLIGDLMSEVSESMPPLSPRVNIAAAKEADVILNYVLSNTEL